jgi:hypothetical protein
VVKVTVEANELKNGKIEKISLVRNGAIRQPFKILKTEEIPAEEQTLGTKVRKFFGTSDGEAAEVAALFIRKSAVAKWLPIIKENGFRAEKEHAEVDGEILVLKQESYNGDEGSLIALTPDVAVMLNTVVKGFDPYSSSASFDENVKASAFYPGMMHAMESLAETVWNVLNESSDPEEAQASVAKQVKSFGNYVNSMVKELPGSVFKMEHEGLTKGFASSNVSSSNTETSSAEEEDMSNTILKEAAPGDLDGLLDEAPAADAALAKAEEQAEEVVEKGIAEEAAGATVVYLDADGNEISEEAFMALDAEVQKGYSKVEKSGDAGAPKSGGSPGNSVVESTSDTGAVSLDEGGVPAGFRKEERTMKTFEDGKLVEKTALFFVNDDGDEIFGGYVEKSEEAPAADSAAATTEEYTPAEVKLFEALGVMVKSMTEMKETVEKVATRVDDIEKTATDAKETADNTVVLGVASDLDESLATLSGHQKVLKSAPAENVEKSEDEIFKGLLPMIESAV